MSRIEQVETVHMILYSEVMNKGDTMTLKHRDIRNAVVDAGLHRARAAAIYDFVFDLLMDEFRRNPIPATEDDRDEFDIVDEQTEAFMSRFVF